MVIPLSPQLFLHQIQSAAKKIHFRVSSCSKMLPPNRSHGSCERGYFAFMADPVRYDFLVMSGRPMFSGVLRSPDRSCGVPEIMTNLFFVF